MPFIPSHPSSFYLRMDQLITEYEDILKLAAWQREKSWDKLPAELSAAKTKYTLALLCRRGLYNCVNAERGGSPRLRPHPVAEYCFTPESQLVRALRLGSRVRTDASPPPKSFEARVQESIN